jgi:hypothetical protein
LISGSEDTAIRATLRPEVHMRGIWISGLCALFVVGCGDEDIDDGTNAEDSSSGEPSGDPSGDPADDSTAGTSDGSTAGAATTTGGNDLCADPNEQCLESDPATCTCNGCFDTCVTERGPSSDCVCNVCNEDEFCMNPENCKDGDGCDPFVEGCHCDDCAEHPMCT